MYLILVTSGFEARSIEMGIELRSIGMIDQLARVRDQMRWSVDRPDHRAAHAGLRIVDKDRDRLRELAGFAVELVIAPTGVWRQPSQAHAGEHLVGLQRSRESAARPVAGSDRAFAMRPR